MVVAVPMYDLRQRDSVFDSVRACDEAGGDTQIASVPQ